jgi:hypothetical protein
MFNHGFCVVEYVMGWIGGSVIDEVNEEQEDWRRKDIKEEERVQGK